MTMTNNLFTKIWEIRYRDIDPDTGLESSDELLCISLAEDDANYLRKTIERDYMECESNPNREFYVERVIFAEGFEYRNSELNYELQQKIYQFYGKNSHLISQVIGVAVGNDIDLTIVTQNAELLCGPLGSLYNRLNLTLNKHFKKTVRINIKSIDN